MLDTLCKLALRLKPLVRGLMIALLVLAMGAAVLVVMPAASRLQAALPALVAVLLWVLCVLVFIQAFATVPARPEPEMRGLQWLGRQLNRGFHWLLLGVFVLISIAAVLITGRLLAEL